VETSLILNSVFRFPGIQQIIVGTLYVSPVISEERRVPPDIRGIFPRRESHLRNYLYSGNRQSRHEAVAL
jgi:hypothetical protein